MSSASIQADADAKLSAEPGPRGMYWTSGERVGDKATIQFGVHRSGPTRVTVEGDRLVLRIPIAIDNGRVDVTARGPLHRVRSYEFGGSGVTGGIAESTDVPWHGQMQSIEITLPPLGALYLKQVDEG